MYPMVNSFLNQKTICVAGGAGFVGSHLCDRLLKEDFKSMIVIDNLATGELKNLKVTLQDSRVSFIQQDLCDYDGLKKILSQLNVDVLINLAVIPLLASFNEPISCFEQNTSIVSNLCQLTHETSISKFIHFSSSEVYGDLIYDPMDENHPLNGTTPYAASKIAGDKLIQSYIKSFEINSTIIRPFNIFGPRQNMGQYAAVIPRVVKRVFQKKEPTIFGSGEQTRDFNFVGDVVEACADILNESDFEYDIINIGSGVERPIREIIESVCCLMDYSGEIEYEPWRQADIMRHRADFRRAAEIIDYEYTDNFDEQLQYTIDWYKLSSIE